MQEGRCDSRQSLGPLNTGLNGSGAFPNGDTGIRLAHNRYDSHAAQDAGRAIRYELAAGRPDLRLARAGQDTEDRLLSGGSIGGELRP